MEDAREQMVDVRSTSEDTRAEQEVRSLGLGAVSWLLTYPQEGVWLEGLYELQDDLAAAPGHIAVLLAPVLDEFLRTSVIGLQRRYVETFDFSDKRTLYLTAHELGDSRKRGTALIACKQMLEQAGYELTGSELPDYLPLLLEFLAVTPEAEDTSSLEQRLAWACAQVCTALPDDSPYRPVLQAAQSLLPQASPENGHSAREEADLAELPYPLHYD